MPDCAVRLPRQLLRRALPGALLALTFYSFPALHAEAVKAPRCVLTWGKKGDQPGEFYSPIGIAINRKDEVYVTDLNNARLQKFSSEGKYLGGFDLPRDTPERKSSQTGGIVVDRQGLIYLTFMAQHKVRVYDGSGKVVREWGQRGAAAGEFFAPGGIALSPDGTLYVADQCNHRVQEFTREGKFLASWGEHGPNPGQFGGQDLIGSRFGGPHFLAFDRAGRVYTTEGVLARVQQLSAVGVPLRAWGDHGDQPGGFGALKFPNAPYTLGPIAVMVDQRVRVWVSSLNDRVQAFTPQGEYMMTLGGPGHEPGQFARPHGMAMDSKGYFYVADAGNQRIQKFQVP